MAGRLGRRCACQGVIEADPTDERDVEEAVRRHQAELRHVAWRACAILRGELLPTEREAKVGLVTPRSLLRRLR